MYDEMENKYLIMNGKTEKKTIKKRTKSNLFEKVYFIYFEKLKKLCIHWLFKEGFQIIQEEENMNSQLSLFENVLKMISYEIMNLSQFKDTRIHEIKRLKMKILKLKQGLEQTIFVLEEKNVRYQDLLFQTTNMEKKVIIY